MSLLWHDYSPSLKLLVRKKMIIDFQAITEFLDPDYYRDGILQTLSTDKYQKLDGNVDKVIC